VEALAEAVGQEPGADGGEGVVQLGGGAGGRDLDGQGLGEDGAGVKGVFGQGLEGDAGPLVAL